MSYIVYCNSCGRFHDQTKCHACESKLKKYNEMHFDASKRSMPKFATKKDRYTFQLRVKGEAS
jgi:recombinational DNA repair protein RecR